MIQDFPWEAQPGGDVRQSPDSGAILRDLQCPYFDIPGRAYLIFRGVHSRSFRIHRAIRDPRSRFQPPKRQADHRRHDTTQDEPAN
jgi:hypothetical protein